MKWREVDGGGNYHGDGVHPVTEAWPQTCGGGARGPRADVNGLAEAEINNVRRLETGHIFKQ